MSDDRSTPTAKHSPSFSRLPRGFATLLLALIALAVFGYSAWINLGR